jgi:chemotaxis response regulator CheB
MCSIKQVDGITIAQQLNTATQPDMPESAIESGCIDFILSPENIAKEIVKIARIEA